MQVLTYSQINKTIILALLLSIGCIACKSSEKEIDKLEIAKQYCKVLDTSDVSSIAALLTDSIFTKETEANYEQTFSLKEYVEWMKWDSVFEPTYKILQIEEVDGMVKAKISKIDKRIFFLLQEPMVTNEVIRFANGKIISVERTEYVNFNETTFLKNRTELLNWIDENHPKYNGFIHNQTETGAIKYLEAIALFKNRK